MFNYPKPGEHGVDGGRRQIRQKKRVRPSVFVEFWAMWQLKQFARKEKIWARHSLIFGEDIKVHKSEILPTLCQKYSVSNWFDIWFQILPCKCWDGGE